MKTNPGDIRRAFEEFQKAKPLMSQVQKAFQETAKAYGLFGQIDLRPVVSAMKRFNESPFREAFAAFRASGFGKVHEALQQIGESFKAAGLLLEELAVVLVELGWPPHPDLDIADARAIVDMYHDHGVVAASSMVSEYMLKRYDARELQSLLEEWGRQKWLAKRMPILTEVVEGHIAGKHHLTIPATFPQIDGIIAERYGHTGRINHGKLRKYVHECLPAHDTTLLSGKLDTAHEAFFENFVMVQFQDWLEPPPSSLSRHSILHGHDVNYGSAANSLKVILLFDYFQRRLRRLVGIGKGKCYHLVGCAFVDVTRGDLVSYEDPFLAKAAGKRPCMRCRPEGEDY